MELDYLERFVEEISPLEDLCQKDLLIRIASFKRSATPRNQWAKGARTSRSLKGCLYPVGIADSDCSHLSFTGRSIIKMHNNGYGHKAQQKVATMRKKPA